MLNGVEINPMIFYKKIKKGQSSGIEIEDYVFTLTQKEAAKIETAIAKIKTPYSYVVALDEAVCWILPSTFSCPRLSRRTEYLSCLCTRRWLSSTAFLAPVSDNNLACI